MRVRMLEDAGFCDGHLLLSGQVFDMTPAAAADYIALGIAEPVEELELAPEPEIETAAAAPPENAARRTKPPTPRKR